MKIGVTGASNAIGRALVKWLGDLGHEAVGVTEVADGWRLARRLAGCEVVVHGAELGSPVRAPRFKRVAVNVEGADLVFRMARRAGARRVVHLSSAEVYGVPDRWPVDEDAPLRPVGAYGRSKLAAEAHAWRQVDDGYDVVVLRSRPVTGPGVPGPLGGWLFPSLARRRGLGRHVPLVLPSRGRNRCQITPLADLQHVLGGLLEPEPVPHALYNVGARAPRSLAEDLRLLCASLPESPAVLTTPEGPGTLALGVLFKAGLGALSPETLRLFDTDVVLDTRRAERDLGLRPTEEPTAALRDAYDWWVGSR